MECRLTVSCPVVPLATFLPEAARVVLHIHLFTVYRSFKHRYQKYCKQSASIFFLKEVRFRGYFLGGVDELQLKNIAQLKCDKCGYFYMPGAEFCHTSAGVTRHTFNCDRISWLWSAPSRKLREGANRGREFHCARSRSKVHRVIPVLHACTSMRAVNSRLKNRKNVAIENKKARLVQPFLPCLPPNVTALKFSFCALN